MDKTLNTFADLEKVLRGRKHYEIIDFPGKDVDMKVAVKVLSQKEIEDCYLFADITYRKKLPDDQEFRGTPSYSRELERQILFRAIIQVPYINEETQESVMKSFFPNSDIIGNLLSIDDIVTLMSYYNDTQEKFSPASSIKSEDDFNTIIDECKKKSIRGLSLSTYELEMLVDYLIANPEKLLKDNGSTSTLSKTSNENMNQEPTNKLKQETQDQENGNDPQQTPNKTSTQVEFKTLTKN